jgi:hypothetical protein
MVYDMKTTTFESSFQWLSIAVVWAILTHVSIAQTVGITFVNNCSGSTSATVDLWITQNGSTQKVEDIGYQRADNLSSVAIFSGSPVGINVTPGTQPDQSNALTFEGFNPVDGETYVIILSGTTNPNAKPNPDEIESTPVLTIHRVPSTPQTARVNVLFSQGCIDAPSATIVARRGARLESEFTYRDFSESARVLDRRSQTFDVKLSSDTTKTLAAFDFDFASDPGSTFVCVLSGFIEPEVNGSTDSVSMLVVTERGNVIKRSILLGTQTALVQLVHALADPKFGQIDAYINDVRVMDNTQFGGATGFVEVESGRPITIALTAATAANASNPLLTLQTQSLRLGQTYQIVMSGVTDSTFTPNPDSVGTSATAFVLENATSSASASPRIRFGNFSTDSPKYRIQTKRTVLAPSLGYPSATDEYREMSAQVDSILVVDRVSNKAVRGWIVDLRSPKTACMYFAGFVDPSKNKNGPSFRPILIETNGTVNRELQAFQPDTTDTVSVIQEVIPSDLWHIAPVPSVGDVHIAAPVPEVYQNSNLEFVIVSALGQVVARERAQWNGASASLRITSRSLSSGRFIVLLQTPEGLILGSVPLVRL